METSLYEMNWYPTSAINDNENLHEYEKIIIISFRDKSVLTSVTTALANIGIYKEFIDLQSITGSENIADFAEQILQKLKLSGASTRKILVINLLPLAVTICSGEEDLSMTANWLCFESNLDVLKALSKSEMQGSKLVTFTLRSFGCEENPEKEFFSMPWAATVLGMARAVNLETDIPLIPIDFGGIPSEEEVTKVLLSLNLRSVEEGLVISPSAIHQPLLQRVKVGDVKVRSILVKSIHNFKHGMHNRKSPNFL